MLLFAMSRLVAGEPLRGMCPIVALVAVVVLFQMQPFVIAQRLLSFVSAEGDEPIMLH